MYAIPCMLGWLVTGIRSMTDDCNNFDQDFGRLLPRPRSTNYLEETTASLGPIQTASPLGTSRRSVINRAHRLGLEVPYPRPWPRPPRPFAPTRKRTHAPDFLDPRPGSDPP